MTPEREATVVKELVAFLDAPRPTEFGEERSVSLFSGAGLSDSGYEAAGFKFSVHSELSPSRAALGADNFPGSEWVVGDIREKVQKVIAKYQASSDSEPDLLVATPPCQGMSSSNPARGKREEGVGAEVQKKNELVLSIIPVARALRPKAIVCENVRQLLTLPVSGDEASRVVVQVLRDELTDYVFFEGVINVADYGIPQDRRRAIVVGLRLDLPCVKLLEEQGRMPWPAPTHSDSPEGSQKPWVTVKQWIETRAYEVLDASSEELATGTHDLHSVPFYDDERYQMVASIPANSGRNAYENATCPYCGVEDVPLKLARCHICEWPMTNRPLVWEEGEPRLIKGFKSSYRRMHPDLPASTVTTNSSHVGSDFKIHPWENRVLSTLECSDLQTVPRWYSWRKAIDAKQRYAIRQVTGEAFPAYFTYLHGKVLKNLLEGQATPLSLAPKDAPGLGHRKTPIHASV